MPNGSRVDRVAGGWVMWWLGLGILSSLQLVVLGHNANHVIGNVALMGLMAITFLKRTRKSERKNLCIT